MTDAPVTDRYDLTGKIPTPPEHFDVVVVGAGAAGTAAALDAARDGKSVLLVDEHPVMPANLGNDVPYYFGGRATGATQNAPRMVEQLFTSNPAIEAVFEAGIDVRLGTAAWALYRNGPAIQTLPTPMLGLADADKASMVSFDQLTLATGARDVALGFPGWDQPGVMGAQGFHALVARYAAFAGTRIVILGTGPLALATALTAQNHGIAIAGFVEIAAAPETDLTAFGAPVHLATTIAATQTGIDGVNGVTLAAMADGAQSQIVCDTIVLAIATTPMTELLSAAGIGPDEAITLIGDAAAPRPDMARLAQWAKALGTHTTGATIACQCEEVTRADIAGVQPPRYLERGPAMEARSLASLLNDGPAHPDQIKRLTRAGMGPCQGRRCREQVTCLLAEASGQPVAQVPVASHRPPVRPIPLQIMADWQEQEVVVNGWDVWFGIATQWTPYDLIGTPDEAAIVWHVGGFSHV